MARDYEKELDRTKKHLDDIKEKMEQVRLMFLSDATLFIAELWKKQVEIVVLHEHELTRSLGAEKLSELKGKLESLYQSAPDIVSRIIGDTEHWWHLNPRERFYFVRKNRLPEEFERALRLAVGYVASILEPYGYLKENDGRSGWLEYDASGMHKRQNGQFYFPFRIETPRRLIEHAEQYAELHREAKNKEREIDRIMKEEESVKTKKLWDEA